MNIKPIETVYNGYRFRSRLEARWAVFFDAAGIKYEYEPEGYVFEDGTKYLPDFFLPDFKIYCEIKPSREMDDGKAEKFAFTPESAGVLVCYGQPSDHDLRFMTFYECDDGGGGCYDSDDMDMMITEYLDGSGPCIYIKDGRTERVFYKASRVGCDYEMIGSVADWNVFEYAEIAARQARFEYGETPNVRSVAL